MSKARKLTAMIALSALIIVAAFVPSSLGAPAAEDSIVPQPEQAAVSNDDEIVLIRTDGVIQVEDPYHVAGTAPATWTSPEGGWNFVTTGDFNGDGDDEILALGSTHAKIYDPFPETGTKVVFDTPGNWYKGVAGDIDADGRDELILLRHENIGDVKARLLIYDGNPTGTNWTLIQNLEYGTQWADLAVGNFIGDSRVELALSRQQVPTTQGLIFIMNAQTGQKITQDSFGYYFERIATGDVDRNGFDEIAAVRNVSSAQGASCAVIFRVRGVGQGLETIASKEAGTPFHWVTAGDYDNDGADEVGLLRNVPTPYAGLFVMDQYSPFVNVNEVIGEGWSGIASGDVNADGKSDVLILKSSLVRAYAASPVSILWSKAGSFRASFATGDIDGGTGVVTGPIMQVSPTSLTFTMDFGSPSPAAQTVQVTNASPTGPFSWTARVEPATDWLSINPTAGTTPGTITVSIRADRVQAGTHTTRIIIEATSPDVSNSPVSVSVTLNVAAPTLVVSPNSIRATTEPGGIIPQKSLRVTQAGGGTGAIHWYATIIFKDDWETLKALEDVEDVRVTAAGIDAKVNGKTMHFAAVDWLTIFPTQGSTPADIFLSFDTTGLPLGTYHATIVVDGGSGVLNRLGYCDVTLSILDEVGFLPIVIQAR